MASSDVARAATSERRATRTLGMAPAAAGTGPTPTREATRAQRVTRALAALKVAMAARGLGRTPKASDEGTRGGTTRGDVRWSADKAR
jgi:hypothetical protein